ncbi:MAG: NAD-dependent epimerase/dehydratase family protein [Thermoanaerobaculia bacterium]
MRLLVAGGAGLLGAAIAKELADEVEHVVVADRFDDSGDGVQVKEWRVDRLAKNARIIVERTDLADFDALEDLFVRHRPAAVVNAALFNPAGPGAGPLFRAARAAGTGLLLHLSDGALYAPGEKPELPAREDEPLDAGDDPVLRSKLEEERMLAELGLPAVVLRVFAVLGPMFPPRRFPARELEAILASEEVVWEEEGFSDFVHIEDVVRGVVQAFHRHPIGLTLNLGGGLLVNPRTILALLARDAGRILRLTVTAPRAKLRLRRAASLAAAFETLGWSPVYNMGGIVTSLLSARQGTGGVRAADARVSSARETPKEPARPVSRRELFGIFRRPFDGPRR